jgi:fatty acid desaturase
MDDWVNQPSGPLVAPQRLKELSIRSDREGLLQLATHLAALIVTGSLIAVTEGTWWMVLPFMAHGAILNSLYAGQHEMSHRTAFRSRWLNDWVGEAIGFLMILPAKWDKKFHFAHHRHTMDPKKDPELLAYGIFDLAAWRLSLVGLPFGWGQAKAMVAVARGIFPDYVWWLSEAERPGMIREARWHLAGYAAVIVLSLWFRTWVALEYWIAPLLVMKCFYQLQNMGEHTGLSYDPDTLRCTRTLKGPALMRRLVWNMSYHAAHHTYPSVPFHRLPELDHEIRTKTDASEATTRGYLQAQFDIVRTLRRVGSVKEGVPA